MDERIKKLRTSQDCERFAKNAEERGNIELALEARRRSLELKAESYGATTLVERECLEAIYAYEEILAKKNGRKTKASRTWQMINKHGILPAVERAVNRPQEASGYIALLEMGLEDYAFESVVIKHPSAFTKEAVERCAERVGQWRRTLNFNNWLYSTGLSKSSVLKYFGAIEGALTDWAVSAGIIKGSILNITSKTNFDAIDHRIRELPIYLERNSTGHSMYGSALNKYSEYLASALMDNSVENDIEEIINSPNIETTEKAQLISARVGQGKFRKDLLSYWGKCAITGMENSAMLLASHIKPWSHCTNSERLDKFNGLLLIPNLDRAFDQGLISFSKHGAILISPSLKQVKKELGIDDEMCVHLSQKHQSYMHYHREHIFKNT